MGGKRTLDWRRLCRSVCLPQTVPDFLGDLLGGLWPTIGLKRANTAPAVAATVGREKVSVVV